MSQIIFADMRLGIATAGHQITEGRGRPNRSLLASPRNSPGFKAPAMGCNMGRRRAAPISPMISI
jgi:hypothetical protein